MIVSLRSARCSLTMILVAFSSLNAADTPLPAEMQKIMHQSKYDPSIWGLYVKICKQEMFCIASTSINSFPQLPRRNYFPWRLFCTLLEMIIASKTPVYASVPIRNGQLQGNLIVVASGDLTMGGRQEYTEKISYTKLDHINANEVPGVILTKENPLNGFIELAKQVSQSGIKEIHGDVIIDDRLFETTEKRDMILSPMNNAKPKSHRYYHHSTSQDQKATRDVAPRSARIFRRQSSKNSW